jgi:hypothetical protein
LGSLFSPAGLFTVGLSTAISLWTVYAQRQQSAASAAKKAADEIKSLSTIQKEFNINVQQANGSALAETVVLTKLFNIAKDETKSRVERTNALKALKNETNGYLDSLTLETIGTEKARKSLDLFNQSLFQSALLKANQKKVEQLAESYGELAQKGVDGKKRINELTKAIQEANKPGGDIEGESRFDRVVRLSKERTNLVYETNNAIKEQNRLYDEIFATGTKIATLQIATTPFTKETTKQIKEFKANILDISDIFGRQDIFQAPETSKFIIPKLELVGVADAQKNLEDQLRPIQQTLTKSIEKINIDAEAILQQGAAAIGAGIGNAIGSLIGGATDLQGALNSIIGVFADFISQLGQSLIAAGTATLAAQALATNPVTAIAAGVLAVAAGAAIRAAISKAPSFATGGGVIGGPTMAMIGDNPGREEYVIPSEVLDKLGNGGGNFIAETRIAGNDLLLTVRRAMSSGNRING